MKLKLIATVVFIMSIMAGVVASVLSSGAVSYDWSLTSYSLDSGKDYQGAGTLHTELIFDADGDVMWATDRSSANAFREYTLTTAYDPSTATYQHTWSGGYTQDAGLWGHQWGDSGDKLYVYGTQNDKIHQNSVATAYDINSTITDDSKASPAISNFSSMQFSPDGTKAIVWHVGSVAVYNLSTAWDISTMSGTSATSKSITNSRGGYINSNGLEFFVLTYDAVSDDLDVDYYRLTTAWDMSTASLDTSVNLLNTTNAQIWNIFVNPAGTKLFVTDTFTNDETLRYSITS